MITDTHLGEELKLAFLANITCQRARVYREDGDHLQQCTQYGTEGPVCRLLYTTPHYDLIKVREVWETEQQQIEQEERSRKQREQEVEGARNGGGRPPVKLQTVGKQRDRRVRRQRRGWQKINDHQRHQKVWALRRRRDEGEEEDVDLLLSL